MMSDSSGDGLSDLDDIDDLDMIMQQVQAEQEKEEAAERVHHRNYIYRERIKAEERLKADYFGPNPKCPLYYFRKRIDCMHWEWRNCPKAWHGQFARGDKKYPTIMLEAVASYDLWIWHAFFG
ncbi:ALP1-like protein isoform X1 [Tanacetum coccineum]|uniref:ALP1-like protein isoform X1 n=1 Tax=Tanacetum coccineum TaxID=301880 RepID=A0ABQ4ZM21_9ASTR